MKLTFFLIAFTLIFLRVYLSCMGVMRENRSQVEGTMTITSDNYREEIRWSGIIRLDSDETSIASISPGGYLKYRLNDKKMVAESNLQGEINYELYDNGEKLALDSNGWKFIAKAVSELIAAGFDAKERMERIYQKGGTMALLNEVGKQKTDPLNRMYIERAFAHDSLPDEYWPLALQKIGTLGADNDKVYFLRKVTLNKLEDPKIMDAFFEIVAKLGADNDKVNIMMQMMDQGPVGGEIFDKIESLGSQLGADHDKGGMYKKLIAENDLTEEQWINIIKDASGLGADNDKADLLVEIAKKMPADENIKAACREAAKKIGSDSDYGRVMRALN
jgi:hypothetical protein